MIQGEITLENKRLKAALQEANAEVKKFKENAAKKEGHGIGESVGESLKEMGTSMLKGVGIGATLAATVEIVTEKVGEMKEKLLQVYAASEKLQTTTDIVQEMGSMAKDTDMDVARLVTTVRNFQTEMQDGTSEEMTEAMRKMGLSAEDFAGKNPLQVLDKLAEGWRNASQAGNEDAAAKQALGKHYADLIPLLEKYAEKKAAAENAPKFTEGDIERVHKFAESWERLKTALEVNLGTAAMHPIDTLLGRDQKENVMRERARQYENERKENPLSGLLPENRNSHALDEVDQELKKRFEKEKEDREKGLATLKDANDRIIRRDLSPKLNQARMEISDPADAAKAMKDQVDAVKAAVQKDFGTGDEEGLIKLADKDRMGANVDGLRKVLEALEQIKDAKQNIRSLDQEMQRMEDMRNSVARGAFPMMNLVDQSREMKRQLAQSLGMEIGSGADVQAGLAKLKQAVDDARAKGDVEGEGVALTKLQHAQQQAVEFAGNGGGMVNKQGETRGALNILTGRSDSLITDKLDGAIGFLRSIDAKIGAVGRADKGGDPVIGKGPGARANIFNLE